MSLLTEEYIEEYNKNGVIVIENIFTNNEILNTRIEFHKQLEKMDINHNNILLGIDKPPSEYRIKGKPSRIFYADWKLKLHLDHKIYSTMKDLLINQYNTNNKQINPFGYFNDILPYIDRVCYRLPDHIRAEGGLSLHLDRNPLYPFEKLKKWKPIQAFITLTDQYNEGLHVIKGFHNIIDDYFKNNEEVKNNLSGGEFYRMNSKSYYNLQQKLEPIYAPAGSLVIWDNRLPHSTGDNFISNDSREVIYCGWIPNIELNKKYYENELINIKLNIPPPAYIDNLGEVDRNWSIGSFPPFF